MILYSSPTLKLIDNSVIKLLDDKVRVYRKNKLSSANLQDLVGELCGYNAIKDMYLREGCAGAHYQIEKEIRINPDYCEDDIIFHEIAHAWQTNYRLVNDEKSLKALVNLEQQANTMAKYFFDKVHPGMYGYFDSYFNDEDIDWLSKYYGDWKENDLID